MTLETENLIKLGPVHTTTGFTVICRMEDMNLDGLLSPEWHQVLAFICSGVSCDTPEQMWLVKEEEQYLHRLGGGCPLLKLHSGCCSGKLPVVRWLLLDLLLEPQEEHLHGGAEGRWALRAPSLFESLRSAAE